MKFFIHVFLVIVSIQIHAQTEPTPDQSFNNEECDNCIYFYNRAAEEYIQVRERGKGGFVFEECHIIYNNSGEPDINCLDEPIAGVVLNQEKLERLLALVNKDVNKAEENLLKINLAQTVAATILLTYGNYRLKKAFPHYAPGMKLKDIENTKIRRRAFCNKFLIHGLLPKLSRTWVGVIGVGGLWYSLSKDWFKSGELEREQIIQEQFDDAFGGINEVDIEENFEDFKAKLLELLTKVSQE